MKLIKFSLISLIVFLSVGYYFSDTAYYKKVINENQLNTPNQVYEWVSNNYIRNSCIITHPYASPRHLMENHKRLWCDEGAMVAAILIHQLGYETRLADFYGIDGIAHHTILETNENQKWEHYDFSFHLVDQSYKSSAVAGKINFKRIVTRPYPKLYNTIINHNYFIKKVVFFLRGITEDDIVS
ncbi:MAG: hypothetical protein H7098_12975 [Oligoflexus sp.]|nr:hypothetical protein [Pseudopedobacter sp.]